jgi:hypothetical protein
MTLSMYEPPVLEAARVYEREYCKRSFEEDLYLYLGFGYVFCTPVAFIMGRPVHSKAPYGKIVDPRVRFHNPDAWWIALASSDAISIFFQFEPYPLPLFGWEKCNKPRFHPREKVLKYAQRATKTVVWGVPGL